MQMTCPKCHGEMRVYERSGVTVDQCTECRGIFLDRGELEKLFEAEANWNSRQAPSAPRPAQAPPAPQPGYAPPPPPAHGGGYAAPPPPAYGTPGYPPAAYGSHQPQYGGGYHGHYRQQGYHGHYRGRKKHKSFLNELFD
jgi:Zn-finger nucleic acid-binding protein